MIPRSSPDHTRGRLHESRVCVRALAPSPSWTSRERRARPDGAVGGRAVMAWLTNADVASSSERDAGPALESGPEHVAGDRIASRRPSARRRASSGLMSRHATAGRRRADRRTVDRRIGVYRRSPAGWQRHGIRVGPWHQRRDVDGHGVLVRRARARDRRRDRRRDRQRAGVEQHPTQRHLRSRRRHLQRMDGQRGIGPGHRGSWDATNTGWSRLVTGGTCGWLCGIYCFQQ